MIASESLRVVRSSTKQTLKRRRGIAEGDESERLGIGNKEARDDKAAPKRHERYTNDHQPSLIAIRSIGPGKPLREAFLHILCNRLQAQVAPHAPLPWSRSWTLAQFDPSELIEVIGGDMRRSDHHFSA
jgi:hypothetical protein